MKKDLAILLADKDAQFAIQNLLKRSKALGIRSLTDNNFRIFVHTLHDPACCQRAHEYMRPHLTKYDKLLVVFDYQGCGMEHCSSPSEIEADVEKKLSQCGWHDRCCVVAIDPELEIWVWSTSPHVEIELGWSRMQTSIREWLIQKHYLGPNEVKPSQPKEAMKAALKEARKPLSAAIFGDLAANVTFSRCSDRAFVKLKETLQRWFPQ